MNASKNSVLVALGLMILLIGVGIGVVVTRQHPLPTSNPPSLRPALADDLSTLNQAFVAVAKQATPAVVNISGSATVVEPLFSDPFFESFGFGPYVERKARSLGSGVIVRPDGYVVTNAHVVRGAQEITVTLGNNQAYSATLVGADPGTDVAVVRIEGQELPYTSWGDSTKLEVGEWVIAIGSPFRLSQTVTAGIVSALGRQGIGVSEYEKFIQTDAAINMGNSGGPLLDLQGTVVGINTAIVSTSRGYEGVGFAIPSEIAKPVVEELISHGVVVRGWTGLIVEMLDPASARELGAPEGARVVVTGWYRPSPTDDAGFSRWDVILSFDGQPVTSIDQLRRVIRESAVGSTHEMVVWRRGQRVELSVRIDRQPVGSRGEPVGGL